MKRKTSDQKYNYLKMMILVLPKVRKILLDKAVENLESKKTKITDKKNMVKLVLQHKQICNVKLSTLALSTKITIIKSPKT